MGALHDDHGGQGESNWGSYRLSSFDTERSHWKWGFRKVRVVVLLVDHWFDRDYIPAQMNSSAHTQAAAAPVLRPSMLDHWAEGQCERRPLGPVAANPRRSPRFRVPLVGQSLWLLGGDDEGFFREQSGAATTDGVLLAGGQQVPQLWAGYGLTYGVAMRNPMVRSHLGICGSNYPLPPSLSTRLFRGCRLPNAAKEPGLLCR